jgi:hypothetical protein
LRRQKTAPRNDGVGGIGVAIPLLDLERLKQ